MNRGDFTNEQWDRLKPLLPLQKPKVGRMNADHRRILNGNTIGQRNEATVFEPLMEAGAAKRVGRGRPKGRPGRVVGGKAYNLNLGGKRIGVQILTMARLIAPLLLLMLLLGTNASTQAQTVVATIPVGTSPFGVAVNPMTNRVYVANTGSNNVSVIDGATNALLATVAVGAGPSGVAANAITNRVYVTNTGSNNVAVIDGATNAILATVAVGTRPLEAGANPATNRVYVSNGGSNNVSVIDGAANAVVATIPVANPGSVAVNPTTNRVYVANFGMNTVSVIDGASNTIIGTISIELVGFLAVNPMTNRIYVTSGTNRVSVIDGSDNTIIASISVGRANGVAVNPTANRFYVSESVNVLVNGNVLVVDGTTNAIVATIPVGTGPIEVAANPTTSRVYAVNGGSNNVSVVQDVVKPPPTVVSTWFFAEGSTQPPFDTWFLTENPTADTANVTFTFFLQPSGLVTQDFVLAPHSRFSLFANQMLPNTVFSTRIDSNAQVFAERAMYVSYDGDVVAGIPSPSQLWLFAEGATIQPFHTWLLLQNPTSVTAFARITYLLESGQTMPQDVFLPSNSRTSIFVNQVLPNAAFSIRVESDQPIIAERAMYRFPGNAATVNSGVNAPATSWFFSEGRTDFRGLNADTFLLLENPGKNQAAATITLFATDGRTLTFPVAVLPTSRLTIFIDPIFGGSFGIKVNSDQPIIAERSVFFGNEPLGAYSTQGATALSTSWHFADGETRDPFDELITVLNPQEQTMGVHIDFELESGQVIGRDFSIAPNSKLEVLVDDILSGANSATVTTSLPSVAERTMFIFKQGSIGGTDTIGVP